MKDKYGNIGHIDTILSILGMYVMNYYKIIILINY